MRISNSSSRTSPSRRTCRTRSSRSPLRSRSSSVTRPRAIAGAEARRTRSSWSRTTAEDRSTDSTVAMSGGTAAAGAGGTTSWDRSENRHTYVMTAPSTMPAAPARIWETSTGPIVGRRHVPATIAAGPGGTVSAGVHPPFTAGRLAFMRRAYRRAMRDQYYEQLDVIVDELVLITDRVRTAVADATTALLDTDIATAEAVIGSDRGIEEAIDEVEERALVLLATQQPVATDLRQLVST